MYNMSKGTASDTSSCHYEWSFQKPKSSIGILPDGNYHQTSNHSILKSQKSDSTQHIPYSGPTLWNPKYHQRSSDKFLTLTPLRPNQKSVESSLPVISITPRRGSREFSFFGSDLDNSLSKNKHGKDLRSGLDNNHQFINDDADDELQKLSSDEIMDKLGFLSINRKKKKEQISMFPDVYALVRSPRRFGKTNAMTSKPGNNSNFRKEQHSKGHPQPSSTKNLNPSVADDFGRSKLPPIPGASLNPYYNSSRTVSNYFLPDKNIQDQGTLFSRQQDAFYARITRDPTVIVPSPSVGFRYVFLKGENQQMKLEDNLKEDGDDGLLKPANDSSPTANRYHRNRLKDRRSYIRWNGHRAKSKGKTELKTNNIVVDDCDQHSLENGKEEKLRAISEKIQALQRNNARNNLETSSSTKRQIAAHFCDVLGQKTCRRCQEFYAKNFQIPPKESVEKIRSISSPLTRENTLTLPTVGLQKVVIRVKGESGRMEIATEEINKQLL